MVITILEVIYSYLLFLYIIRKKDWKSKFICDYYDLNVLIVVLPVYTKALGFLTPLLSTTEY